MTTDKIEECNCPAKEMEDCAEDKKVDGKCPEVAKTESTEVPSWVKDIKLPIQAYQVN